MDAEKTVGPEKNEEPRGDLKKKPDRERKKSEKKMDQFLKSISNLTSDEKIEALCKKNVDALEEVRNNKGSIQTLQRRITLLEKEKEQLQNDQSKGVLQRSRLETLCRELQRQNKSIKDESLQKIREEEEKRKEVSTRFQTALNEVTQMMQQNTDKNLKLRDDNLEISSKFHKLCDQFKLREEEVLRLTKQMDLEKQLSDAQLKRAECQLAAEREVWLREKEQLLSQMKLNQEERLKLQTNAKNMEEHLSLYSTRYEEFETTINKSNQVFDSYKTEMSRMTKQVNKLEKDCKIWKDRWVNTSKSLSRMLIENEALVNNLKEHSKKVEQLTKLCRMLQDERGVYLKQLKENSIVPKKVEERSPTPTSPATTTVAPAVVKTKGYKITKKEKQLAELKKEMVSLETQLADASKPRKIAKPNRNKHATSTHDAPKTEQKPILIFNYLPGSSSGPIQDDTNQNGIETGNCADLIDENTCTPVESVTKDELITVELAQLVQDSNAIKNDVPGNSLLTSENSQDNDSAITATPELNGVFSEVEQKMTSENMDKPIEAIIAIQDHDGVLPEIEQNMPRENIDKIIEAITATQEANGTLPEVEQNVASSDKLIEAIIATEEANGILPEVEQNKTSENMNKPIEAITATQEANGILPEVEQNMASSDKPIEAITATQEANDTLPEVEQNMASSNKPIGAITATVDLNGVLPEVEQNVAISDLPVDANLAEVIFSDIVPTKLNGQSPDALIVVDMTQSVESDVKPSIDHSICDKDSNRSEANSEPADETKMDANSVKIKPNSKGKPKSKKGKK